MKKVFKRQKPVTAVLNEEIKKSMNAAGLVKKDSIRRRNSIVSPHGTDFDFNDPKSFEVTQFLTPVDRFGIFTKALQDGERKPRHKDLF
jgi:hypothetical protein